MKETVRRPLIIAAALLLSGCLVQSFYPFYTNESKVKLPQVAGRWELLRSWGDDVTEKNIRPWIFTETVVTNYDENGSQGIIDTVYFKVGDQLYCDSVAGKADERNVNWYWLWHVRPVHTVSKVEIKGDVLKFRPLDYDWLTNALAFNSSIVFIAQIDREEHKWPLVTATPKQWEQFLAKYGADTNAFPDKHIFVLKKHKVAAEP